MKRPLVLGGGLVRRSLGEGGFTLIELLIATSLVLVVSAVVAVLAAPMRRAFDRGMSSSDTAARGRTALTAIVSEAQNAGSGVVIGPANVALHDVIAVVTAAPPGSVAITRASGAQGLLSQRVDVGAVSLRLDSTKPCSEQDATCGIRSGDVVAIFDAAMGETVAVSGVNQGSATLYLAAPLTRSYDPGAVIATIERTTFTLRDQRLVRVTAGGAEQTVADHVLAFAPVLAAGRIDVQLTLEPASGVGAPLALTTSAALRR